MKNLEKRTHHKVRALFAENKVHFARGEQGFLICTDVCRGYGTLGYGFLAFSYETEANQ